MATDCLACLLARPTRSPAGGSVEAAGEGALRRSKSFRSPGAVPDGEDPGRGRRDRRRRPAGAGGRRLVRAARRRGVLRVGGPGGLAGRRGRRAHRRLRRGLPSSWCMPSTPTASPGAAAPTSGTSISIATSSTPASRTSGTPPLYHRVHRLLNPDTPPSRADLFLLRAAWAVCRHGLPALRAAVAEGQYDHPSGLFFGGHEPEASTRLVRERFRELDAGCRRGRAPGPAHRPRAATPHVRSSSSRSMRPTSGGIGQRFDPCAGRLRGRGAAPTPPAA